MGGAPKRELEIGRSPYSSLLRKLLERSFQNPIQSPQILDREVLRNRKLNSKKRRELADVYYDSLRWRRKLWGEILPTEIDLYELQTQLEKIRSEMGRKNYADWSNDSVSKLGGRLSYPDWLLKEWLACMDFKDVVDLTVSLNERAKTDIRVNLLKANRISVLRELQEEGWVAVEGELTPWAIRIAEHRNFRSSELYKKGKIEIQDQASQFAAWVADPKSGSLVVDACCGAGGKSLALAAALQNKGKILSVDSDSRKLDELRKRAKRLGVKNVVAKWCAPDDPKPIKEIGADADLVIVDAPCSSLGTLRRSPWLKWHWTPTLLEPFPALQARLLERYAQYVKPKGRLVYITCTLRNAENRNVVDSFLQGNSQFDRLEDDRTLLPNETDSDGFFISILERKNKNG